MHCFFCFVFFILDEAILKLQSELDKLKEVYKSSAGIAPSCFK